MIISTKGARFFQRKNVGGLFDHTEQIQDPRAIGTNFTKLVSGEKSAANARPYGLPRRADGAGYLLRLFIARLDKPKRDPFGRARPYSRHLAQLRDQLPQRNRISRSPQGASCCRAR